MARSRHAVRPADTGPDIRDAIAEWMIALGGKAPATRKIYLRSAERLATWLETNDHPTGVLDIGPRILREFVYRALQQFFKFLVAEGDITETPMARVEAPSQTSVPVPVMDIEDLHTLAATANSTSFEDRRDLAILRLLIDTGMRIGELTAIEVDDVELDRRLLTVRGKTGERILMLEQPTIEALRRFLKVRRHHHAADRPELWLSLKGHRIPVLTHWGIRQIVDRRVEQAGLKGRVYPHRFRHTYAHRWLANGGQEHDLMYNAGWRSPSMIARYGASAAAERARAAAVRSRLADQV